MQSVQHFCSLRTGKLCLETECWQGGWRRWNEASLIFLGHEILCRSPKHPAGMNDGLWLKYFYSVPALQKKRLVCYWTTLSANVHFDTAIPTKPHISILYITKAIPNRKQSLIWKYVPMLSAIWDVWRGPPAFYLPSWEIILITPSLSYTTSHVLPIPEMHKGKFFGYLFTTQHLLNLKSSDPCYNLLGRVQELIGQLLTSNFSLTWRKKNHLTVLMSSSSHLTAVWAEVDFIKDVLHPECFTYPGIISNDHACVFLSAAFKGINRCGVCIIYS